MNRRKILRIGGRFLPLLFGEGASPYRVVQDPLPPDTRIVNCQMCGQFRDLVLLLESEHWPEVADLKPYPEIEPQLSALRSALPVESLN